MLRFHTPFAGFEPPPHLAEAYRRKLLQQQKQSQQQQPPATEPSPDLVMPSPPRVNAGPPAAAVDDPAQRRFMLHRAGFAEAPAPPAPTAFEQTMPDHPRPGISIEAVPMPSRPGKEPLRPMPLLESGVAKVIHETPATDATEGIFSTPPSGSAPTGAPPPLPHSTPSTPTNLRHEPEPMTLADYQSLPPPGPPPEGTRLHELLGRDPDNALKFFNLTKWPPPRQLHSIRHDPQRQHLADSRPRLVMQWLKDTAAARPDTLTHNGAVRYLLNTLKDTLRTDYTRRGQPVPEDAQLDQETFHLIDHTLAEARQPQASAPSAPAAPTAEAAPPGVPATSSITTPTGTTDPAADSRVANTSAPAKQEASLPAPNGLSASATALLPRMCQDTAFAEEWHRATSKLPAEWLSLTAGMPNYGHLAQDRSALALEWFARRVAKHPQLLITPSADRELWLAWRNSVKRAYEAQGLPTPDVTQLDTETRRLIDYQRAQNLRRHIPEGAELPAEVQTALSEQPPLPAPPPEPTQPKPNFLQRHEEHVRTLREAPRGIRILRGGDFPAWEVAGIWQTEDLPDLFADPTFTHAEPAHRAAILNQVLGHAFEERKARGPLTKEAFLDFGRKADAARKQLAEMETLWEKTKEVGSIANGALATAGRSTVALVTDGGAKNPDGSWKVPYENVGQQMGYWFQKAGDTLHTWSTPPTRVESALADLKKQIDEGNFPLDDPAKLGDWLEQNSHHISGELAQWYDQMYAAQSGERDPWTPGYEQTNGLLNPLHASLLGRYLQTRDPEAWDALRASLLITPWRARTNAEQAETLRNSAMVRFLTDNVGTGADYGQYMAMAGDPIQLALMLLPVGRVTGAIVGGIKHGGVRVAAATGLNVGLGAGLGMVGAAVENPNATWEDYKEAAKHGVISALTMQAVGKAYELGKETFSREHAMAAKRAAEAAAANRAAAAKASAERAAAKKAAAEKAAGEEAAPPKPGEPAPPPAEPPKESSAPQGGEKPRPPVALPVEPPLPQQTPEAWKAQQNEYAQYDAQLSPDQQFTALRREFPDADPRVLGRIVAEFDSAKGLSLSSTAREKLGLPDPGRPAGAVPAGVSSASVQPRAPAAVGKSPRKLGLIKGSALDQWADKILAGARGNTNAYIDPVVGSAAAIKGAVFIESGIRTFAEWSQHMLKEFGETIRPHLEELWQRSSEHLTRIARVDAEAGTPSSGVEKVKTSTSMADRSVNDARRGNGLSSTGTRRLAGDDANGLEHVERLSGNDRAALVDKVWEMQKQAYEKLGNPYSDSKALLAEDTVFDVVLDKDKNAVAFCICKETPYGVKVISFGTNGSLSGKAAGKAFLLRLMKPGYYAELSGAPLAIAAKLGLPKIPAKQAAEILQKDIEIQADGFQYSRQIKGLPNPHTKVMIGTPWTKPKNS